jgi:Serine protease inhibitor
MLILLPPENSPMKELEAKISSEKLEQWCGLLEAKQVDLRLPKFLLESEVECNMPLQNLGMKTAFTRDADFSGINGMQNLYLGDVRQKIYLRVNESGTEAAAATGAVLKPKFFQPETKPFYVNKPFVFVLRKKAVQAEQKDVFLFIGRLVRPEPVVSADPALSGEGGEFN